MSALVARGVRFEICEITLRNRNQKKEQFVQEANFTPSGVVRIAKLQEQGAAYAAADPPAHRPALPRRRHLRPAGFQVGGRGHHRPCVRAPLPRCRIRAPAPRSQPQGSVPLDRRQHPSGGGRSLARPREDQPERGRDRVFQGRIPFVGRAGSRQWIASLKQLIDFDARVVIPGHGPLSTDALADPTLTREYLLQLRKTMGEAARELEPFDEACAKADWSRFEHLPLFLVLNRMSAHNTNLLMEQQAPR